MWTSGSSLKSAIAAGSSHNIHMVWEDNTPGNHEIYYKRSTSGGGTWNGTKRLSWNSAGSFSPVIAADSSNNIHVVWFDSKPGNYELYYKRSTNSGVNWSGSKRLTWSAGSSSSPAIAVDSSNNVHVAWYDKTPGNEEIFYKRSTNGGVNWSGSKRFTWNPEDSTDPAIAVDSSGNIHVVWKSNISGTFEIYHKRSTDAGATWGGTKRLTWSAGNTYSPAITTGSSNTVYLVWTLSFAEIYFKKSTNAGVTWGSTKRLTWKAGESSRPAISVDPGNNIHVVWQEEAPGNYEVYYKRSTNGGSSWTTKRLSWNPVESEWPAITTDTSNRIHVVWEDFSPGNYEIFYRRGIQ
jgi:hypothetical protein